MSHFKAEETITFVNKSDHLIILDSVGLDPVPAGGTVEVPLHLAAPTRRDSGNRGKSPIEQVAPQLEPKDPEVKALWLQAPEPATPVSKIVSITPRAPSEAPGVKALREKREAQATAAVPVKKG